MRRPRTLLCRVDIYSGNALAQQGAHGHCALPGVPGQSGVLMRPRALVRPRCAQGPHQCRAHRSIHAFWGAVSWPGVLRPAERASFDLGRSAVQAAASASATQTCAGDRSRTVWVRRPSPLRFFRASARRSGGRQLKFKCRSAYKRTPGLREMPLPEARASDRGRCSCAGHPQSPGLLGHSKVPVASACSRVRASLLWCWPRTDSRAAHGHARDCTVTAR